MNRTIENGRPRYRARYGRISRTVQRQHLRSHGLLGGRREGGDLDPRAAADPRRLQSAVLPVVSRRRAEHLRQRAGPPRRGRPRRAAGADLRLAGDRVAAHVHLPRTARRDGAVRRRAARAGRRQGRPGRDLHADGARGGDRNAGVRTAGRGAFGGVRRVRRKRARSPHRRRPTGRRRVGLVRRRTDPDRRLQTDARRRAGDRRARTRRRA